MKRWGSFIAALAALLASSALPLPTSAQVELRPNADPFRPTAERNGFLTLPSAAVPGHLHGGGAIFFDYTHRLIETIEPGVVNRRVDHRAAMRLAGILGLGRITALHLDLPFVLASAGPSVGSADTDLPIKSGGIADPRVSVRVRAAGARPDYPGHFPKGFGLAFELGGALPLGDQAAFAGEGQLTLDARAHLDYFFAEGAGLSVSLGWLIRPYDRFILDERFRDALLFGVGMRLPIPMLPAFAVRLEVRGMSGFDGVLSTPVEGDIGFSYAIGPVSLLAFFGTGFTDAAGAPLARAMLGMIVSRRVKVPEDPGPLEPLDVEPALSEDRAVSEHEREGATRDDDASVPASEQKSVQSDAATAEDSGPLPLEREPDETGWIDDE